MDQTFLLQLNRWNEEEEYQKIIEAVEALPEEKKTPVLISEMACAYNNLAEADDSRLFEKAAELGARYVISSVWSPDREYSLAQLETICDMAQKYNLLVNLEFMAFANVRTLEESLEVMDQVNRPNLRLMVDTLHAHRAGVTQEMLKKVPAEKFGFVHLCDGPAWIPPDDHPDMAGVARSARLYVGEGGIDIAGMLHGIAEIPYYSIELPNAAEIEAGGKLAHAARCLDTAKRYLTANGLL